MAKVFFIAPASAGVGLTSVCLGLLRALDSAGLRVGFFKPFAQSFDSNHDDPSPNDRSVVFAREMMGLKVPAPMSVKYGHTLMSQKQSSFLMEQVVQLFHTAEEDADVVIVEGLVPSQGDDYSSSINVEVARNLDAEVILVATPEERTLEDLEEHISLSARLFASPSDPDIIGCILNKTGSPAGHHYSKAALLAGAQDKPDIDYREKSRLFHPKKFHLIAQIPWRPDLVAPRTSDITKALSARVINYGDSEQRRVMQLSVVARTLPNMVARLKPGTLVVVPGDREDIIVACSLAALTGVPLAGLLLTGGLEPDPRTLKLCLPAMDTGLPIITTTEDTFTTANQLATLDTEVPVDDKDRFEMVVASVANQVDIEWLSEKVKITRQPRMSPAAFRYQLTKRAREADKTIVLPEGAEPRTVQAAAICSERGIARCILLGRKTEIESVAEAQGITLPDAIGIIDPEDVREKYIDPMVELRKHKGLTPQMAEAQLEDNVVLGTMMLAMGEVDGLVSGAIHTTANTVRPAFQLIKARPDCRIVSSVFFMCLPEQVVVYGDCAINPDPDAEELADIALQCADSASLFGINPKVAMLSYSTGTSGSGSDVDKVKEATRLAKEQRPELLLDGPLQYDAAAIEDVARKKTPNSKVAGQATVFVFPDLNTGNTTYKAVQRSANVISVGPMLQGLKKPVNDLSRGALVDDIVFTIALTAVQATQNTEVL
ncbi:phosphate acetyltransferase [Hahella ganghwensis]|uniref:phosphate acetyltransferase n=1 Tax=Hahella ganghwensis TaxID=286420 RepID=UPI0003778790|nr:phosphate acetyltransferase [Hahella ganghwensis]